jgi:hypothetical protein
VLNTAGILGVLVVAASQLGLAFQHKGSLSATAWCLYALFAISLFFLGLSIVVALRVQGDIQGDFTDPTDLLQSSESTADQNRYNVNVAKTDLLYAISNWCLNNEFKFRLNSAQGYLRNGIIAIIAAGALSPWAISPASTSTTSALVRTAAATSVASQPRGSTLVLRPLVKRPVDPVAQRSRRPSVDQRYQASAR